MKEREAYAAYKDFKTHAPAEYKDPALVSHPTPAEIAIRKPVGSGPGQPIVDPSTLGHLTAKPNATRILPEAG
jgi:hypothetical protein